MFKDGKSLTINIATSRSSGANGAPKRLSRSELLRQLAMKSMFNEKRCAEFYSKGIIPELNKAIGVTERNRHPRTIMYGGKRNWSFVEFSFPTWRYVRGAHRQAFSGQIGAELVVRGITQSM